MFLTRILLLRQSSLFKKPAILSTTFKLNNLQFQRNYTSDVARVQVSVLGAESKVGKCLTMLLKLNPLISCVNLYGIGSHGIAADLNHFDTRTKIYGHCGPSCICAALRTADIVVMVEGCNYNKEPTLAQRIMKEGKRVFSLTRACTKYAPKATMVVCVNPVSVMVPLVAEIFKETHFYHPARLVGSPGSLMVFANSLVGKYHGFDPEFVNVPIVGGPDQETAVPLFSHAEPSDVDEVGALKLSAIFKNVPDHMFPKTVYCKVSNVFNNTYDTAYGLNRMISSIALGLHGDDGAIHPAFIRTSILDTCSYLMSTVKFTRGVFHNFGLPPMSPLEIDLLSRAAALLKEREQMALEAYACFRNPTSGEPSFVEKERKLKKELEDSLAQKPPVCACQL